MRILISNAYIYDDKEENFCPGEILVGGDRILKIIRDIGNIPVSDAALCAEKVIDARGAFLLPGFVDIHTHGRAGFDFVSADKAGLEVMAMSYLAGGTTTVMPTLASAPFEELLEACDRINAGKIQVQSHFAGIHLEGRYLNPKRKGAHLESLLMPLEADELETIVMRMNLPCRVTAALELDSDGSFAARAASLGVKLSLGHTDASYEQAMTFYQNYGVVFSHTWNAMPPLHHRGGGAVSAALDCGAYCEIICDGMHIAPEIVRLTYKCKGNARLALITDSMEAAGCPDGQYSIAGQSCYVKDRMALTADGALAGSTLDMKTALENLMNFCDIPLEEAVRCATLTPAEAAGLADELGSLTEGKRADILMCRQGKMRLSIEEIVCGGVVYAPGQEL